MWKWILVLAVIGLIASIVISVNEENSQVKVANQELAVVKLFVNEYVSSRGIEPKDIDEVIDAKLTGEYEIENGEVIGKEYG
jgi:hypothetical protein